LEEGGPNFDALELDCERVQFYDHGNRLTAADHGVGANHRLEPESADPQLVHAHLNLIEVEVPQGITGGHEAQFGHFQTRTLNRPFGAGIQDVTGKGSGGAVLRSCKRRGKDQEDGDKASYGQRVTLAA
jgi:hypothetical protein